MLGIDFGAKKAGTTALAYLDGGTKICVYQTSKGADADKLLREQLDEMQPKKVFIDAPLSLPGVYTGLPGMTDYFYRECDKETSAMSPMFLGGLTARAMKLRANYPGLTFLEAYPGGFMRNHHPELLEYKKDKKFIPEYLDLILTSHNISIEKTVNSWHQFDAVICLLIGLRYQSGIAKNTGYPAEGLIYY